MKIVLRQVAHIDYIAYGNNLCDGDELCVLNN